MAIGTTDLHILPGLVVIVLASVDMTPLMFVTRPRGVDAFVSCKVGQCMVFYHHTKFGCYSSCTYGEKAINVGQVT